MKDSNDSMNSSFEEELMKKMGYYILADKNIGIKIYS